MDRAGSTRPLAPLDVICDGHARVVRIAEALATGDLEFVSIALEDLARDLRQAAEREHRWEERAA